MLQVQCMAFGGVAGGEGTVRLRRQGDVGASHTGCTAPTDQKEDRGGCPNYLHHVHCPHHGTGIRKCSVSHRQTWFAAIALIAVCFPLQIVKVLTLYTPVIEFEERVSTTFITTIKVSWDVNIPVFTKAVVTYFLNICIFFYLRFRTFWKIELSQLHWWWTLRRSFPSPSPFPPPVWLWRPFRSLPASIWASSPAFRLETWHFYWSKHWLMFLPVVMFSRSLLIAALQQNNDTLFTCINFTAPHN